MEPITIESDECLDDIEHHFRVFAGPGAGKTYWLINHVKNVIRNSSRLSSVSYVACISYTNVAVNEIVERLGPYAEFVESSTIHSFLYRNVVKPYLHLIKDENGVPLVDYVSVDGHDEHRPSDGKIRRWLDSFNARFDYYGNKAEVYNYVKKLKWIRDENDSNWNYKTIGFAQTPRYFPTTHLNTYKQFYWKDGIVDHEDVLYFAYLILEENPLIRKVLSARFPYIFVDEFQDTNPVQTQVVKWLVAETTIVGAIGDVEQSIYSFQGANYLDFQNFNIEGSVEYKIENNRRSTDNIIDLLNHLRTDNIEQMGYRQITGEPVFLYVGEITNIISNIKNNLTENETLTILARSNEEVNRIKRSASPVNVYLWSSLEQIDPDRFRLLEHLVGAGELARQGNYSFALDRIIRGLRIKRKRMERKEEIRKPFKIQRGYDISSITDIHRRALAVALIEFLMTNYHSIMNGTLLQAYEQFSNIIQQNICYLSLIGVSRGRFKDFSESTQYDALANSVNLSSNESRIIRTIHQAKGAQFKNLLVSFNHMDSAKASEQLNHILSPNSFANSEEKRITYVSLSRAEDRLFLSMPEILPDNITQLELLRLQVVSL